MQPLMIVGIVVILALLLGVAGNLVGLAWALVVGALIGWLATVITKTDTSYGIVGNILVGLVGSWLGRWFFGGVLGLSSANSAGSFDLVGLIWGVVGAVLLLVIVEYFTSRSRV